MYGGSRRHADDSPGIGTRRMGDMLFTASLIKQAIQGGCPLRLALHVQSIVANDELAQGLR